MQAILVLVLVFASSLVKASDRSCGVGEPCRIATGEYHLAFPDRWDEASALPAILFFHGHGSSGNNIIKAKGLRSTFTDAGYLLIAPTGRGWPGHKARGWAARADVKGNRDNIAFTHDVLDDVARRIPLDRQRIFVSGFSSGGSLAWYLACYAGDRFAGFASIAGALRRPIPDHQCPSKPFRMIHLHGFEDRQVPLEGRWIRDWHQGDVFESLALLRTTNQCRSNPIRFETAGIYHCRIWDDCDSEQAVKFCLHAGGHGLPRGWAEQALKWFENTPR